MILRKYRTVILEHMMNLTASEMRLVLWMALNAQYQDGRIILNRRKAAEAIKVHPIYVNMMMPRLISSNLIEKMPGRGNYRVNITFPLGRHMVTVKKRPLFTEE